MHRYKRKLVLLAVLLAVYIAVSYWVLYSKQVFIKDVMQARARLFFTHQSIDGLRETLIRKADALGIPLREENLLVEKVNHEVIYIEMRWEEPLEILFFHIPLQFAPKVFGLIRSFAVDREGKDVVENLGVLAELSDSTTRYLRNKTLRDYFIDYFAR